MTDNEVLDDILRGNWDHLKADVQKRWGKISDAQMGDVAGDFVKLAELLREHYALSEEDIQQHVMEIAEKYASFKK